MRALTEIDETIDEETEEMDRSHESELVMQYSAKDEECEAWRNRVVEVGLVHRR
jgi:hypothetical protein